MSPPLIAASLVGFSKDAEDSSAESTALGACQLLLGWISAPGETGMWLITVFSTFKPEAKLCGMPSKPSTPANG
jgi:hypothetical protein